MRLRQKVITAQSPKTERKKGRKTRPKVGKEKGVRKKEIKRSRDQEKIRK
jgi:hypothetical protein